MTQSFSRHPNRARGTTSVLRVLAVAGTVFATGQAFAGNASLDAAYGFGGGFLRDISAIYSQAKTAALQPDGKLLIAGLPRNSSNYTDFGVIRHLGTGAPDLPFGDGTGKQIISYGTLPAGANDIAYTANGIYMAGFSTPASTPVMTLTRLTTAGAVDTGFGIAGAVKIPLGQWSSANALAVQRDGKVVVVGYTQSAAGNADVAIARINPDGTPDTGFGTMGKLALTLSATDTDIANGVAVREDGRIIVVAETRTTGGQFATAAICLTASGSLDTGFGSGGIATLTRTGYPLYGRKVAIDPQGNAVIASKALQISPYYYGVDMARLLPNGTLDTTYGAAGHTFTALAPGGVYDVGAMELLPTGQALVAGQMLLYSNDISTVYVARFGTNGGLDATFNNGVGYRPGDIGSTYANWTTATAVPIAPDGKFYLSGTYEGHLYALRYLGDPLDVAPASVTFAERNAVPRSSVQTSETVTVSGLTAGARVPITVSGGSYIRNGEAATTRPGYVANGDTLRLVHTASSAYSSQVTTTVTFGGLSPANNRGTVLGEPATATFTTITEADTGGITPPIGGDAS